MDVALVIAVVIGLVLATVLCAYLVWVMWAGYHRQWKRLAILASLPILMVILFKAMRAWDVCMHEREEWAAAFGLGIKRPRIVASYYYPHSWSGDYTSIEFYELTDEMRRRFQTANDEELRKIFRLYKNYHDLHTIPWRKTPFDREIAPYLDKALVLYKDIDNEKCRGLFAELGPALDKPGSYYALWHNQRDEYFNSMGLFVVAPENNWACAISFSH